MSVWTNNRYEYRQIRRYHGSVKAVVFDWAGTVVDCGVFSPMNTFVKIFAKEGVHISESEARGPMGIHKRAHIEKILELEEVHDRWVKVRGAPPTAADVDRMYAHFVPIQMEAVADSAKPIDGVIETVAALRQRGIKIGSCTGYPMAVVNILKEEAAKFGYAPDCYVAADEVPASRPLPHMVWLNAIRMNVSPIEAIVKVDDTIDGIREGLAAGCWTVAVARTGNYTALEEQQLASGDEAEIDKRVAHAYSILVDSGAHYVIDSVADLMPVIDDIERRLRAGEKP